MDDKTEKELVAMLNQARNAGFDFSSVEGQNKYRRALETAGWINTAKEVGGSMFFKAVLVVGIGWLLAVFGDGIVVSLKKVLGLK